MKKNKDMEERPQIMTVTCIQRNNKEFKNN